MQQNIPCRLISFRRYSDYVVERAIQDRILSGMDAPLLGTALVKLCRTTDIQAALWGCHEQTSIRSNQNLVAQALSLCTPAASGPYQIRLPGHQV
jgi:hypothetical protein